MLHLVSEFIGFIRHVCFPKILKMYLYMTLRKMFFNFEATILIVWNASYCVMLINTSLRELMHCFASTKPVPQKHSQSYCKSKQMKDVWETSSAFLGTNESYVRTFFFLSSPQRRPRECHLF